MSINKFNILFVKNKPFFRVGAIETLGFWIFELMVSIVILMVTTLVLLRFSCNMIALEADSINRLRILDHIASHLDSVGIGSGDKSHIFVGLSGVGNLGGPNMTNMPSFGQNKDTNKGGFELKTDFLQVNIVKSNLPESIKSWQKSSSFRVLDITVSCKSAFGRKNVVKILARAANGQGE